MDVCAGQIADRYGRINAMVVASIGMTVTLGTLTNVFGNATLDAAGNPTLVGSAGTLAKETKGLELEQM